MYIETNETIHIYCTYIEICKSSCFIYMYLLIKYELGNKFVTDAVLICDLPRYCLLYLCSIHTTYTIC